MEDIKINFLCDVDADGIKIIEITDLETSKYLKRIGYNKPSHWYWLDKDLAFVKKGLKRVKYGKRRMNHNKYDDFIYSAPTKDEVLKFLKISKL